MAGSSYAPWALISEPSVAGLNLASALNCSSPNNATTLGDATTTTSSPLSREGSHHTPMTLDPVMECLKGKHFSDFTKFTLPKFSVDFGPSVDGIVIKPNFRVN
jgi:hypothetical protein